MQSFLRRAYKKLDWGDYKPFGNENSLCGTTSETMEQPVINNSCVDPVKQLQQEIEFSVCIKKMKGYLKR